MSLTATAAADIPPDDGRASASERRTMFLVAIVGSALIVGAAGLLLLRRRRRLARDEAPSASPSALAPKAALIDSGEGPTLTKICPACGQRYPGGMLLCPDDKQVLVLLN